MNVKENLRRPSFSKKIASDFVRRLVLVKQSKEEAAQKPSPIDELVGLPSDAEPKSKEMGVLLDIHQPQRTTSAVFGSEIQATTFLKAPVSNDGMKSIKSQTYETKPLNLELGICKETAH